MSGEGPRLALRDGMSLGEARAVIANKADLMVAALRRNRSLEPDVLEREIARVKAEKRRALQKLNGEGA
jgi:hypothetical protein